MPLPSLQNQVLPSGQLPYVQQQNMGQMVGEVIAEVSDADSQWVYQKINGIVRKIYDRRTWYGLMIRGQIATTGFTIGGTVVTTQGSQSVVGTGTSWTPKIIGQQFRIGYNTPPYTITQLDTVNQVLTLEMPWASPSFSSQGYFIAQYYYSPGPNIKYIHTARNLLQAWRMRMDYNQQTLDVLDPWRVSTLTPYALAQMPADPNGNYQVELYPVPSVVQALPFIAVVQPPNLVKDSDTLPPYIRTDIVVKFALADAKVYRGPKLNKYYDMVESQRLRGEAEMELNWLAQSDENLYRQNIQFEIEGTPMAPDLNSMGGSFWAANHGVSSRYSEWF